MLLLFPLFSIVLFSGSYIDSSFTSFGLLHKCNLNQDFPDNLLLFLFLFWLHWVFVAVRGLSLVAVSGGYSSLRCAGFSLRWLLLLQSMGSRHAGFSSCGSQALECRLSSCGARAPWHVRSSPTRALTRVPLHWPADS